MVAELALVLGGRLGALCRVRRRGGRVATFVAVEAEAPGLVLGSVLHYSGVWRDKGLPSFATLFGGRGGGGRVEWGQQMLDRRMLVLVVLQQGWPNG